MTFPAERANSTPARSPEMLLSPRLRQQGGVAAFFDVDNTLTRTNSMMPLAWYRRASLSPPGYALWAAMMMLHVPYFLLLDRFDRARSTRALYRHYAGLKAGQLRDWHRKTFAENLKRRLFLEALPLLCEHRARGHRLVLISAGLDFVLRPLAEHLQVDGLFASALAETNGYLTGELSAPPLSGPEKAVVVRRYAEEHQIDLTQSYAYGDSWSDANVLECVGNAVAVNPDRQLRRLARERGWRIVRWRA